jgi:hypothetical protein
LILVVLTEITADILHKSTKNSTIERRKRGDTVKKACAILLLAFCLAGCRPQTHTDVASHIVTEITITCQTCNDFTRRHYNTHEKMQKILLYLRSIGPGFTPDEDPEPLAGRVICITLYRADGTTKIYRQKDDLYLQEGVGPWRKIKPEWGASLYQIILENDSDPEIDRNGYHPLPGSWQYSQWVAAAHKP